MHLGDLLPVLVRVVDPASVDRQGLAIERGQVGDEIELASIPARRASEVH